MAKQFHFSVVPIIPKNNLLLCPDESLQRPGRFFFFYLTHGNGFLYYPFPRDPEDAESVWPSALRCCHWQEPHSQGWVNPLTPSTLPVQVPLLTSYQSLRQVATGTQRHSDMTLHPFLDFCSFTAARNTWNGASPWIFQPTHNFHWLCNLGHALANFK